MLFFSDVTCLHGYEDVILPIHSLIVQDCMFRSAGTNSREVSVAWEGQRVLFGGSLWGMWSKNFLFILLDGKLLVPKGNRLILWGEILWPLVGTKELKRLFCTCNVHPLLKNRPCIKAGVPIKADYWWSSADYETAREKVLVILVKVIYVLVLYVGWQILLKTSLKNQTITQEVSLVRDADELESAHVPDSVERNEIKEEISGNLLEGLNELDKVKNEESEAITSQGLEAEHHVLAAQKQFFLFTGGRRAVPHSSIIRKKRVLCLLDILKQTRRHNGLYNFSSKNDIL